MQRLIPEPGEIVSARDAYRDPRRRARADGPPWVLCNMIATVDGAIAVEGRSGALGGTADREVFHTLRALADVILVGAGTVRAERYGPPRGGPDERARRIEEGSWPEARIAIVSGRLELDLDARLFHDPSSRTIVVTHATADPTRMAAAAEVAEVVVAGDDRVDAVQALAALGEGGARVVCCEGGPLLNRALLGAELVDELCLTLAPLLSGAGGDHLVSGPALPEPARFDLAHALVDDDFLFLRSLRHQPRDDEMRI